MKLTLQQEIANASEFGQRLREVVVAQKQCPGGDRETLLIGYWSLIFDYHMGIMSLLLDGFHGSACALVRPVFEALIRSHIALMGSDDDVRKLIDDTYVVNFKTVGAQIDAAFGLNGLLERFLDRGRQALHSYAHSGRSQVGRQFDGTNLKQTYSEGEMIEVVQTTTSATWMVTNLVTKHFKFDQVAKTVDELFTAWGKNSGPI
jgi:hypothetical protein